MKKLILPVMFLGLVACGGESATEVKNNVEPTINNNVDNLKHFGITPNEFTQRLAKLAKEVGLADVKADNIKTEKGEVNDTFTLPLGGGVTLTGTVNKEGQLKGLTYILGKSDKFAEELIATTFMAGLSARALSPELPKEKTAGEVVKLLSATVQEFNTTQKDVSNDIVFGNVKCSVMINSTIGVWIVFEPV